MKLLLKRDDCWDAVIDDVPDPITSAWTKKDNLAMTTLGLSVDDSQLVYIRNSQTAKDVWSSLEKQHLKTTLSNKIFLMRKIFRMKLNKDGDMEAHLSEIMDYVDKLKELGEEIFNDKIVVAIMLSSLPDDYDNLITALEARPEEELTLEAVKMKLIDVWQRKERINESKETALSIVRGRKSSEKPKKEIMCFFCRKKGHFKADCEKYKKWQVNKEKSNNSNKEKVHAAIQDVCDDNWCFIFNQSRDKSSGWLIDSGATSHICKDKEFFEVLDMKLKESVFVGNGVEVLSEGRGNGKISFVDNCGQEKFVMVENVMFVPNMKANLLSVKKLVSKGFEINFQSNHCEILRNKTVVAVADIESNLYKLRQNEKILITKTTDFKTDCIHVWHRRLGHRDVMLVQ